MASKVKSYLSQRFAWIGFVFLAISVLVLGMNFRFANAASAQHLSILAESIQPLDSTIQFNNSPSAYLVTTTNSTANPNTSYVAQVNLPDGAVISGINVYGLDSDSLSFGAALYRYNQDLTPVYQAVTAFTTSVGSAGKVVVHLTPLSNALATVDNLTYSYGIYIDLPKANVLSVSLPNLAILRIVVDWGYPTYLPVLSR
jgi:hypothetical protein